VCLLVQMEDAMNNGEEKPVLVGEALQVITRPLGMEEQPWKLTLVDGKTMRVVILFGTKDMAELCCSVVNRLTADSMSVVMENY